MEKSKDKFCISKKILTVFLILLAGFFIYKLTSYISLNKLSYNSKAQENRKISYEEAKLRCNNKGGDIYFVGPGKESLKINT